MARRITTPNTLSLDEREAMIDSCRALAIQIASRRYGHVMDHEDLESAAWYGLFKASIYFDPAMGYQFGTYAGYWVRAICQEETRKAHRRGLYQLGADKIPKQSRYCFSPDGGIEEIITLIPAKIDNHEDVQLGADLWELADRNLDPRRLYVLKEIVIQGRSYRDLANELRLSRSRIQQIYHSALALLRESKMYQQAY